MTQEISSASTDFLAGGGEMGERIRARDWSRTPLGPVERWPQSLKTIVRIMLTSRQPIWIGWGPELIKLYNDPYKAIVGGKHPEALGQPAAVVWHEIWDDVGPRLQTAVENNEGTYDESLLLIMERNGYPEETYYTFSYSPVPGDQGGVGGIICANTDDTQRIIGERQVKLLRTLTAETADARTIEEACRLSAASLEYDPYDLPFAMLYLLDAEKQLVYLADTSGIQKNHEAVPEIAVLDAPAFWPFAEVLRKQKTCIITDLDLAFDNLPTGAWKRPPHHAVAVPIAPSGNMGKAGVLIVGLNPFRLFDESYQGFINLVAGQIAASIGNAQAYEEERKRAEALAEIDRAKTLFFSNVSHELRTPLTLMLGPIEDTLAEDHMLSPEQRERAEILHRNALRLLKLVNTLLDFSRLEAGRVQVAYEASDLATLTADLASSFRSVIEKAGMRLTVDCSPLTEPVYVDREMWEKILLNLLSNAFKYTLEGEISVTLRQRETAVEVSVADTGVGIPPDELPHMFERFHRVKGNAGRSFEGTGIGLSLVQELVKLHGGTISVNSTPGKGSAFIVSLPLGTAHLPTERIVTSRTHSSPAGNAQFYTSEMLALLAGEEEIADVLPDVPFSSDGRQTPAARVLFADDNADMREYVSRLLRQRFTVQTVSNGKAALAAVKEFRPNLILTDVMMPGMDGFELLQALRADPETRTLPVILLSARAGEEANIEGMEAGADDYLIKPFSARELLARVGAHLEMARIRKEAEQRIRAERQHLHDLFMQAPAAIVILQGADYRVELANPTTLSIWGRKEEDILHKPLFEAMPEIRGQGLEPLLEGVFRTGIPYVGNELKVSLDRAGTGTLEDVFFTFVYTPLRDAASTIEGIMVFAYDVTEQVRARERVEALSRQKDEFIGVASHELKTPVTSLKGYAQLLARRFRKAGDERAAELLEKMDGQLNKLTDLIGDLLDVTRLESGQLLLHKTPFDFNELIREIVEEIQHTTTKHRILLELAAPVTLSADRDRIGQVLTNLLTNAIKYSPQADTIIVRTACSDQEVITSVQDFGIGIAREKQEHIFERFFRVEGEMQATYPGLGLGLYIATEFVKRHRGSMRVESEEEKGTTISFSLPLQNVEATLSEEVGREHAGEQEENTGRR